MRGSLCANRRTAGGRLSTQYAEEGNAGHRLCERVLPYLRRPELAAVGAVRQGLQ
uniref:Uncharacterized protein n=1 Tax=Rhizophora mucronata TaxID=61149 RepID=A0A2P2PLD8_RHIMU